jgi:hypothetical protein
MLLLFSLGECRRVKQKNILGNVVLFLGLIMEHTEIEQ